MSSEGEKGRQKTWLLGLKVQSSVEVTSEEGRGCEHMVQEFVEWYNLRYIV